MKKTPKTPIKTSGAEPVRDRTKAGQFASGNRVNPLGRAASKPHSFADAIAKRLQSKRFSKRLLDQAEAGSASALKIVAEYLPKPVPAPPTTPAASAFDAARLTLAEAEAALFLNRKATGRPTGPWPDDHDGDAPWTPVVLAAAKRQQEYAREQRRFKRAGLCQCGRPPGANPNCGFCQQVKRPAPEPPRPAQSRATRALMAAPVATEVKQ
jgi:hypothetical protein